MYFNIDEVRLFDSNPDIVRDFLISGLACKPDYVEGLVLANYQVAEDWFRKGDYTHALICLLTAKAMRRSTSRSEFEIEFRFLVDRYASKVEENL